MAGTKLHIVSCFALFALLVAPLAWRQTQVERVALPSDSIRALAWNQSRLARPPRHVLRVVRLISHGDDATTTNEDAAALRTLPAAASSHVEYITSSVALTTTQKLQLVAQPPQSLDDALVELLHQTAADAAFSLVLLCNPSEPDATAITVGKHRHAWSHACSTRNVHVAKALATLVQSHVFPAASDVVATPSKTRRARVAVKYRLQFSLLHEGADASWAWKFDQLEKRYLAPVLQKLESVAQFTIEQQSLHFARLAKEVHTDAGGTVHYVKAEDLKHFKSTNDFLTSSVLADREQVLHFMAVVPSADHTPLVIRSAGDDGAAREATAFEIPSWGVVVVLDPRELTASSLSEARELQRVMGRFISELRTLLGLPSFISRQRLAADQQTGLEFLPSPRDGVAQWELDVVVQSLLRQHVRSSVETLQSIVQLVDDMAELSVLGRVAQRIALALELVERVFASEDAASDAQLLEIARRAVDEADAAYYDHTMIRQLYFPQEQMLGVFTPLLAPLLLPFFVGWLREMKQLRATRRAAKAKNE